MCEPCPACEGKGITKTARTVAYNILREILREARQFNPKEFRILAYASSPSLTWDAMVDFWRTEAGPIG